MQPTRCEIRVGKGGICQELVQISLVRYRCESVTFVERILYSHQLGSRAERGGLGGVDTDQLRLLWRDGIFRFALDERFAQTRRADFGSSRLGIGQLMPQELVCCSSDTHHASQTDSCAFDR